MFHSGERAKNADEKLLIKSAVCIIISLKMYVFTMQVPCRTKSACICWERQSCRTKQHNTFTGYGTKDYMIRRKTMKLILAIVNDDDAAVVSGALTKAKLSATKLATTGGYLKAGNTTFIIGVENEQDMAIEIIGNNARKRTQIIQDPSPYGTVNTMAMPLEITVGGATVFVLDVESFHKL